MLKRKVSSLFLVLLVGLVVFPASAASKSQGWEEQAFRSGFLARQERWVIASDVEVFDRHDNPVSSGAMVVMRGGLSTYNDPPTNLVFFAPSEGENRWFLQRANEFQVYRGKTQDEAATSLDQWWSEVVGASSLNEWLSWISALPAEPSAGRCRFSRFHETGAAVLPSNCKWNGNTIRWLEWSGAPVGNKWSMWVPSKIEVVRPDRSRIVIETAGFEVRGHGEGEIGWPFATGSGASRVAEPEIPLDELDYHSW